VSDQKSGIQGKNVDQGNAHVDVSARLGQGGKSATPPSAASQDASNVTVSNTNKRTSTTSVKDFILTSFPPFSDIAVADTRRRSHTASSDSASTTSSSSSARARRGLAFKLNNKAGAWSPQVSKASASTETSTAAMTPHYSKENQPPTPARGEEETAEQMTRRLSQTMPSPLRIDRSRRRSTAPTIPIHEDEPDAISPTTSRNPTSTFPSYSTQTLPRQSFGTVYQRMASYPNPFGYPDENEREEQAAEQQRDPRTSAYRGYRVSPLMSTPHSSPEVFPTQPIRSSGRKRSGAISSPEGQGINDTGKQERADDDAAPGE